MKICGVVGNAVSCLSNINDLRENYEGVEDSVAHLGNVAQTVQSLDIPEAKRNLIEPTVEQSKLFLSEFELRQSNQSRWFRCLYLLIWGEGIANRANILAGRLHQLTSNYNPKTMDSKQCTDDVDNHGDMKNN